VFHLTEFIRSEYPFLRQRERDTHLELVNKKRAIGIVSLSFSHKGLPQLRRKLLDHTSQKNKKKEKDLIRT